MTQYACFDSSAPDPKPILGWYDTGLFAYPNLPAAADLFAMTAEQWAGRMTGQWAMSAGALVAYTPPAPVMTLAQTATTALSAGLAITSTSGAWTATFPAATDSTGANVPTLILSELTALQLSSNATFADGSATVEWPDTTGALHAMSPAQFQAFAKALGAFVAGCRKCIIGVTGATLPAATATIL